DCRAGHRVDLSTGFLNGDRPKERSKSASGTTVDDLDPVEAHLTAGQPEILHCVPVMLIRLDGTADRLLLSEGILLHPPEPLELGPHCRLGFVYLLTALANALIEPVVDQPSLNNRAVVTDLSTVILEPSNLVGGQSHAKLRPDTV